MHAATHSGLVGALTIVTHDLRSPLANLAILIELIETYAQMQELDRVKASTRKAQDVIQALDAMLNGILQRVRDTGDPLSFKPALVDLADVVQEAIEFSRPIAESRGIKFDQSDVHPFELQGDKALLTEAVDNLVSNAVKHAPEGSTVTCAVMASGRDAVIVVSDEGQGLTDQDLKRAFRPFATLPATYRSRGPSWGLGLWIVRLIAERHGGRVRAITSDSGRGAQFEVRLPGCGL